MSTIRNACVSFALLSSLAFMHSVGADDEQRDVNDKRFHKHLLRAAAKASKLQRVDGELRWSPRLCRTPLVSIARFSASKDDETHGRKLYFLSASNVPAYRDAAKRDQPVGQVLIKEAWEPERVKSGKADIRYQFKDSSVTAGPHGIAYAAHQGQLYKIGAKHALFIMLKLDAKTEGTDKGWVYGTVTPDGKSVTSAGRVASCMECHTDAKRDRMFGIKLDNLQRMEAIRKVKPPKPNEEFGERPKESIFVKQDGKWIETKTPLKGKAFGRKVEVKVVGRLNTGIAAIGGETTGIIITANGVTWEVKAPRMSKLWKTLEASNKKLIGIHGWVMRVRGVEIKERIILDVKAVTDPLK